jgi:hypothetical protein
MLDMPNPIAAISTLPFISLFITHSFDPDCARRFGRPPLGYRDFTQQDYTVLNR